MRRTVSTMLAFSGLALVGCAQPAAAPNATASDQPRHRYEEPNTGSLFGGHDDDSNVGNGINDPGMQSMQHGQGGH